MTASACSGTVNSSPGQSGHSMNMPFPVTTMAADSMAASGLIGRGHPTPDPGPFNGQSKGARSPEPLRSVSVLAAPYLAAQRHATPAVSGQSAPFRTLPSRACLAPPNQTLPGQALSCLPSPALPVPAGPLLSMPALPSHAIPRRALPRLPCLAEACLGGPRDA